MDYGIREHQRGDDSQDVLNTLIALRHGDTVPDHLDMLKGSLTEDPRVAEFKAVAEGLMLELLVTGEFSQLPPQAPAVEPKITLASQDTITKLTDLLVSVNS